MTDPSIFPQGSDNPNPESNENEALNTLLASIKNDQGEQKYDSLPKALEGLRNAQEFIPQLKGELSEKDQELADLRSKVAELSAVHDVVEKLTAQNEPPAPETPPQPQTLNEQDVAKLLQQQLDARDRQQSEATNAQSVINTLTEKFGTEAEKNYVAKAQELGMTVEGLNNLSKTSPQAVLALFGGSAPKSPQPLAGGGLNTSGYEPPKETFIKRNEESVMSGFYSTEDLHAESKRSKALVDELHAQGLESWDLADPKTYAKVFGKL